MNNSRDNILCHIKKALQREDKLLTEQENNELYQSDISVTANTIIANENEKIDYFCQKARARYCHVIDLPDDNISQSLLAYFKEKQLLCKLQCDSAVLKKFNLYNNEFQIVEKNLEQYSPSVTLCQASAGIAETSSCIFFCSAQENKLALFTPETLIVILEKNNIFSHFESFHHVYSNKLQTSAKIHFITGPSGTSDINATLVNGASGAKHVVIILIHSLQ